MIARGRSLSSVGNETHSSRSHMSTWRTLPNADSLSSTMRMACCTRRSGCSSIWPSGVPLSPNGAKLDCDDLQSANGYRGVKVYGRSKLCNILYTRELARRSAGTRITANCLHPGFVATRFGDQSGGLLSYGVRIAKTFALSPEKGAETIVYLASASE